MATWDISLNVSVTGIPLTESDTYNMTSQGFDPNSNDDQKLYIEKALKERADMALSRILSLRELAPSEFTVTLNTP
jgi:hypothetical protein